MTFDFTGPSTVATLLAMLLLVFVQPADAQQVRRDGKVWAPEVEELLDRLARGRPIGTFVVRAFREEYVDEEWGTVDGAYERYTDEERMRLLDALEAAARGELDWEDELARTRSQGHSFAMLRSLAYNDRVIGVEVEDIVRRMLGIYRESRGGEASHGARHTLAHLLPLRPPQAAEMRDILEREARGEGRSTQGGTFLSLLRACEEGMAILRRVHREGHIRDPIDHAWISQVLEEEDSRAEMERKRGRPCPGG